MKYLIDRMSERSTWVGLIAILSAFGVVLSPEQTEAVVALGAATAGAVGIFTKG